MSVEIPRKTKKILFLVALAIFLIAISTITPQFSGLVTKQYTNYEQQTINKTFTGSEELNLSFKYPIDSLRVSGKIIGEGNIELILTNGTTNLTIFKKNTLVSSPLTGFVIRRTRLITEPKIQKPTTNKTKEQNNNSTKINPNSTIKKNTEENKQVNKEIENKNQKQEEKTTIISSIETEKNKTNKKILESDIVNSCEETCFLKAFKAKKIIIKMDKNMSFTLTNISFKEDYPIKQIKQIPNQSAEVNETIIISLNKYYNHSKQLIFDLPKIEGLDAKLINNDEVAIRGSKPGNYTLFVYALNERNFSKSNNFRIEIKENKKEKKINLSSDLLQEFKKKNKVRIIIDSKNISLYTETTTKNILDQRRTNIQQISITDVNQFKAQPKKYFTKITSDKEIPIKQITNKYVSIEVNQSELEELIKNQNLSNVKIDQPYSVLMEDVKNITETNKVLAEGYTGSNESICILDTGANIQYLDPETNITKYNILNDSTNITDTIGHGTSIAYAINQLAPEANLIIVKVVNDDGIAYATDIIKGIDYCTEEKANIISISLGSGNYSGYCDEDLVAQKINSLNSTLVVVASGNDGNTDGVTSPACARKALSVGSTSKDDKISYFSNYNNATLLFAPGEDIETIDKNGNQILFSGTSISAPIVAAISSLILENNSKDPQFNISFLGDLLVHTGNVLNNSKRYFSRINAYNALIQNVTNNLSTTSITSVNGSETSFKIEDWTVNYSNDFSSALTGWSGETSYFSTSNGVLTESDWQDHMMYRGEITDSAYQIIVKIQDTDDNNQVGVVMQTADTGDYYACYLDTNWQNQFNLDYGGGNLVSTTHTMGANTWFYLKVEVNGTTKKCKTWDASTAEPTDWAISTTDSSRTAGYWGVYGSDGVQWDDFQYLTWTTPPYDPNVTATKFDGSTTDFTSLDGPNVTGLTLENTSYGKIQWNNVIDVENMNYDEAVFFGAESVYVNISKLTAQHNSSANVTFYNVKEVYPVVYKNGELYKNYSTILFSGNTFEFNVSGFSNYSLEEGTRLNVGDSSDNRLIPINESIIFYANYTNITNQESLNGSNFYCEFKDNFTGTWSTPINMTFNTTSKLYEINKSFSENGTYVYNISCFDTSGKFANLTAEDNFEIQPPTPKMKNVSIEPVRAQENESLKGYCLATDVDSPKIIYYYRWYKSNSSFKEGELINITPGIEINVDNISSTNTSYGETWILSCRASDGNTNSSWVNSSITKIISGIPTVTINSPANNTKETYFLDYKTVDFNCTANDDLNLQNISLYLSKDNSAFKLNLTKNISGTNNNTIFRLNLTEGFYSWNCKVYDNDSSYSWGENNFTYNLTYIPTILNISDDSDNKSIYINSTITFYADYSNNTNLLTGTETYCEFSENSTGNWSDPENMSISSNGYYYVTKTFPNNGTFYYNISCFTDLKQRNKTAIDNFTINYAAVGPPPGWNIVYADDFSKDTSSRYVLDGTNDWIINTTTEDLRNNYYSIEVYYYNLSTYNGEVQILTKLTGAYRSGIAYCYDDSEGSYYTFFVNTEDTKMQWNRYDGYDWYGVDPYGQYDDLTPTGLSVSSGTYYWLRIYQNSTGMYVKIWYDGDPEPTNWQLASTEVCSGDKKEGFFGKGNNPYAYFDDFEILLPRDENVTTSSTNEAPVIQTAEILPEHLTIDSDLEGYCNATDADNSTLNFYYKWYKNGVLNTSGSINDKPSGTLENINNLSSTETEVGDYWTFSCMASDGNSNTSWINKTVFIGENISITTNPIFTNSTTSHSFTVLAGVELSSGADHIKNFTINYNTGSCTYDSNSTINNFFNVTYICTGNPSDSTNINVTFCDDFNQCNTTETLNNQYPNQIPILNGLISPTNNNFSLINRNVNFSWNAATDAEDDPINYSLFVTNAYCADFEKDNFSETSFNEEEFNTAFECQNNVYEWKIKACDPWGCSNYSETWNFSIQDYLEISLVNNEINFSTLDTSQEEDTSDNNPAPFIFENTGNINANLTDINSSGIWSSVGLDTQYYQFKINRTASEPNSFDWDNSQTTWTNMTNKAFTNVLVGKLNYSSSNNEVAVDIHLIVPTAEPPGTKKDTISFTWESAD